jgi:hypothetical protein
MFNVDCATGVEDEPCGPFMPGAFEIQVERDRKLVDCLAGCFAGVPELNRDTARAKKVKKSGSCCDC